MACTPFLALLLLSAAPSTLTVGAGKQFGSIEGANKAAKAGDTIEIYRAAGDGAYHGPAIYVTKAGLRFIGRDAGVTLDGKGFDYSGVGSIPRAIFQVSSGADGVTIENLTLRGAHNASHNGAGVRINAANKVTVRGCDIFGNDMGIMSNGQNDPNKGADELIENCKIHENGDRTEPGYNHNLYLGGTSLTVQFCEIFGSTTGHNLKSRAHFLLAQYNYIHDAANREIDLVDAWDTEQPHSNTVVLGNIIVKDHPAADGNRTVIHFGQDGGLKHAGTVFLIHNTIVTKFASPIVQLSSPVSRADFRNNVIVNTEQAQPMLVAMPPGMAPSSVTGSNNWISSCYGLTGTSIDAATRTSGDRRTVAPPFADPTKDDYRLPAIWAAGTAGHFMYQDGKGALHDALATMQYAKGPKGEQRPDARNPMLGAASSGG